MHTASVVGKDAQNRLMMGEGPSAAGTPCGCAFGAAGAEAAVQGAPRAAPSGVRSEAVWV